MGALAVQFGLYTAMLQPALRAANLEAARPGIKRWIVTVLIYQTAVVVVTATYVIATASGHPHGLAWTTPAVGAVIGTALPLQLAVASILRAARR